MNIIWALIIAAVGALFITGGRTGTTFGLYRLLGARSRVLWGDRVHGFCQVAVPLIIAGAVTALTD